jgi:hypothetical protein
VVDVHGHRLLLAGRDAELRDGRIADVRRELRVGHLRRLHPTVDAGVRKLRHAVAHVQRGHLLLVVDVHRRRLLLAGRDSGLRDGGIADVRRELRVGRLRRLHPTADAGVWELRHAVAHVQRGHVLLVVDVRRRRHLLAGGDAELRHGTFSNLHVELQLGELLVYDWQRRHGLLHRRRHVLPERNQVPNLLGWDLGGVRSL